MPVLTWRAGKEALHAAAASGKVPAPGSGCTRAPGGCGAGILLMILAQAFACSLGSYFSPASN